MSAASRIDDDAAVLRPVGVIRSSIVRRGEGPRQGHEGVRAIDGLRLQIGPMEAIDGTPVVDSKPVLK